MMFATKQELNKNSFRSKIPKHEAYEHQQNQKSKMTDYQGIIPDRKLTVKRGVFPYAIHSNPVSKREVFGKDQHVSDSINKNDSHCFQKPKNSFNLFKKKAADERPLFENNPKPSTSTEFFATKPQQPPATPLNTRNPREDVTFSNCSNTTEKNKQVLLNLYLQEQYNSVLKTKIASTDEPNHINFSAEEAFQICTYKQVGEVVNQSFIEKSSKFKCSLNMTSSIKEDLRKLHFERKNKERNSKATRPSSKRRGTEIPQNTADTSECTAHKQSRPNDKFQATSNNLLPEENQAKQNSKSYIKDGNFRLKDPVLKTDTLSHWKGNDIRNQSDEGNDKPLRRYPHLCNMPEQSYGWNKLATPPPLNNTFNFIRDFEMKKQDALLEKFDDGDKAYNKSPLFPTQREITPDNPMKSKFKAVNSPTLFFSDTDDSVITPKVDKRKTQMPAKNHFSLDSAVFKRKFSPELINPIDMMNCPRAKSPKKKTTRRRKIVTPNPSYSDSTCHGVNPFKRSKKTHDNFLTKRNDYSKFDIRNEKYNLF